MATRDLTMPYMRLRSALHRKAPTRGFEEGGSTNLLAAGAGSNAGVDAAPISMQGASPVYVEMVSDVQNDINSIQLKSASSCCSADGRKRRG
jgi:hypothetical protein